MAAVALRRAATAPARAAAAAAAAARRMSVSPRPGDIFSPTPEHQALRETVRTFVAAEVEPQALAFNREERFNGALFKRCGELGLLGITADPAVGGAGMDATAVVIAHEELAASDPAFTLSYLAHSLLFVNNLNFNGDGAQKARYLPAAVAGDALCGMGMSEPGAGTDVLAMKTTAAPNADGSWTLNGTKMWITNGARTDTELGDAFLVYAATPAAAAAAGGGKAAGGKAGGGGKGGHTLFLVDKGTPGFSLGTRIKDKCGMRASNTAELVFDGVTVPPAAVVGAPGDAVLHMMRNLEIERLALAAMSLGIARRCIEVMNKYARDRVAFGSPLNRFGQIQRHVGESYAEYAAGRAYVYNVAAALDLTSAGNRVDSDAVKLYCSVMATTVANRAMQVLGGNGYVGEYVVERLWRDAKLLEIGGGTLEAHQKNITRDLSKMDRLP
jgi:isovaleryl-CoA dehydrogenase